MIQQLYSHFQKYQAICTDTREIKPNAIFFALKGDNFNANQFAEKAIHSGCALAVIDEEQYKIDGRFIVVEDVLTALQELANYHRKQLSIPLIGITGTNGKTTTKELINAVLSQKYKVLATRGNLNNHIGVPLTLLSITKEHQMAIIEMGANHQEEIAMLCNFAEPDFGMITNIGKAHLEGFGGYEGVIKAKREMYDFIKERNGILFVNSDNDLLKKLSDGIKQVNYGTGNENEFIGLFEESNPFVHFKCKSKTDTDSIDNKQSIKTQLTGKYNFENILAAACIGNYFGVSDEQIKIALENYIPSNNRSQVVQTANNFLLLDAYNANPSSMRAAIENFAEMKQPNKMVILGDMLELGSESAKEHHDIVKLLLQKNISNVVLVGWHFTEACEGSNAKTFATSGDAYQYLSHLNLKNTTILIKGSRGIKLEKVVDAL